MENIFSFITERYAPTDDLSEADYLPSTSEILQKLKAHTGNEDITAESVFSFLRDNGYEIEELSDLYFVWLLKSRD